MRFTTLDGLRGFAAVLVLFFHLGPQAPIATPAGYLSVDLFFGLSGFVLSRAYEKRLGAGLTIGEFFVARLVRIYPMAFVGAALGVLASGRYLLSLLLLPDLGAIGTTGALYPANVPLWSLGIELLVSLAFAIAAPRLAWRGLGLILAASAAVTVAGLAHHKLGELGMFWSTAGYGLARTLFSFTLGVAMQRLHETRAIRRRETRLAWLLPLALLGLLTGLPAGRTAWDLAAIFLFLPAILWLGTIWETSANRLFSEIGALSYPLYCIQGVVLQAYGGSSPPAYLWIVLIAAAWWLNSRVDVPLRRAVLDSWRKARGPLAQPQAFQTP